MKSSELRYAESDGAGRYVCRVCGMDVTRPDKNGNAVHLKKADFLSCERILNTPIKGGRRK